MVSPIHRSRWVIDGDSPNAPAPNTSSTWLELRSVLRATPVRIGIVQSTARVTPLTSPLSSIRLFGKLGGRDNPHAGIRPEGPN